MKKETVEVVKFMVIENVKLTTNDIKKFKELGVLKLS